MKQADIFLENRLVRMARKETARTISKGSGVVEVHGGNRFRLLDL
ncbi:MAG: hypothetical protein U0936_13510 [Planctomycetaceae bacterium]